MRKQPRDAADDPDMFGRDALPLTRRGPVKAKFAGKRHSAPSLRDDVLNGDSFVRHPENVEEYSTLRQALRIANLSIDAKWLIEPHSTIMTEQPDLKVRVGDNLMTAISAVGKTQAQIARDYNLDKTKLNHWIKGVHFPDPEFIVNFCKDYNITTDWIYRGEAWGVPGELGGYLRKAAEGASAAR